MSIKHFSSTLSRVVDSVRGFSILENSFFDDRVLNSDRITAIFFSLREELILAENTGIGKSTPCQRKRAEEWLSMNRGQHQNNTFCSYTSYVMYCLCCIFDMMLYVSNFDEIVHRIFWGLSKIVARAPIKGFWITENHLKTKVFTKTFLHLNHYLQLWPDNCRPFRSSFCAGRDIENELSLFF